MWSLFVPPCMFFEAGQPVAKRLRPCARVCVFCMCVVYSSILFVVVVQEKRLREYWLCLRAGNRNRSSIVTCFTGTHGGGTPGNPHKQQSINVPWKLGGFQVARSCPSTSCLVLLRLLFILTNSGVFSCSSSFLCCSSSS